MFSKLAIVKWEEKCAVLHGVDSPGRSSGPEVWRRAPESLPEIPSLPPSSSGGWSSPQAAWRSGPRTPCELWLPPCTHPRPSVPSPLVSVTSPRCQPWWSTRDRTVSERLSESPRFVGRPGWCGVGWGKALIFRQNPWYRLVWSGGIKGMEGGCQPEPEIAYPHLLFHVLDVEHRLDLLPHLPPGPCAQGQVLAEVPLYDLQGQPVGNICTLLTQTLNTYTC